MSFAPVRTCVGCGRKTPQAELLRIGKLPGAACTLDEKRTLPGRGAYICPREKCVDTALKRRAFERALKISGGMTPDQKADLKAEIAQSEHYDRGE